MVESTNSDRKASEASSSQHSDTTNAQAPTMRHRAYIEKSGTIYPKPGSSTAVTCFFWRMPRPHFVDLRGSHLKVFRSQDDECPDWEVALQNARVKPRLDTLEVQIQTFNSIVEFVWEDVAQFQDWADALVHASQCTIRDYYSLNRRLGGGQFGLVLLAKDRRTKELFAVKVIEKDQTEVRSKERMEREMEILRLVCHPNIVRLYDLFDSDRKLYFVLEYMRGGALFNVLQKNRGHPSEHRVSLMIRDVLQGLVYCHEKGIVHRDINPGNILTTGPDWPFTCKLADFGLSNFLDETAVLRSRVGTPYYCAREVVAGEDYGAKADLWSIGVVTFELLCGQRPFVRTRTNSVLRSILDCEWEFSQREWSRISKLAKDFISKLICGNVSTRLSALEALSHPWIADECSDRPIRRGGHLRSNWRNGIRRFSRPA